MCGVRTSEDPTQPKEPDPHHERTGGDSVRGEGEIGGESGRREDQTQTKEQDPKHNGQRGIQRGAGGSWMGGGEKEAGTGVRYRARPETF